jgi:hypothetical protein
MTMPVRVFDADEESAAFGVPEAADPVQDRI